MLLLEDKLRKFNKLQIADEFGGNDNYDDYPLVEDLYDQVRRLDETADVYHGYYKTTILTDESSSVIKIPFNVSYYEDEETGEIFSDYIDDFTENNCMKELNIYEEAEAAGFGEFLAKTTYYKNGNSGEQTTQERCNIDPCRVFDFGDDKEIIDYFYGAKGNSLQNFFWRIPKDLFYLFMKAYGLEKTLGFIKFAKEHFNGTILSDLHSDNYGTRISDGTPCIFDFAGIH